MAITHYETLGVDRDATKPDITAAFRAQMRALHADAGGDDELAKRVSSAYNVLSNPTKRADYDRTLERPAPATPRPAPSPRVPPRDHEPRRRVMHAEDAPSDATMLTADATAWDWYVAPDEHEPRREHRRLLPLIIRVAAFALWLKAAISASAYLGLPLASLGIVSPPLALLCGLGVHLVWSVLTLLRLLTHRIGLAIALGLTAAAAGTIYIDAGTPLPMLGAPICMVLSTVTTWTSFGRLLALRGDREQNAIIDGSFVTQVGATSIGARPADLERLLGALVGAFGHRAGARVILLPDRVTPRPDGASPIRAQAAVVVGSEIHLIAIPPIGGDGLEVSGSDVISDGLVHRNVVRDEVQALTARIGRAGKIYGYVVPTRLTAVPASATASNGVTFGSLTQVIDMVGTRAGAGLDKGSAMFRHRALESMSALL